jgi:hypothetical protein
VITKSEMTTPNDDTKWRCVESGWLGGCVLFFFLHCMNPNKLSEFFVDFELHGACMYVCCGVRVEISKPKWDGNVRSTSLLAP